MHNTINGADGLYFQGEEPKEKGSVLHKDIRDVKDGLEQLQTKLDQFKIPETVGIEVELEIDDRGTKVRASVTRMLNAGETMENAHETLYRQCLVSLNKLV